MIEFTSIFSASLQTAATPAYSFKSKKAESVDDAVLNEHESFIGETFLQAVGFFLVCNFFSRFAKLDN